MNTPRKGQSFGCSVSSILLLMGICSVAVAMVAPGIRSDEFAPSLDHEQRYIVGFGMVVLLPMIGMLIGHGRFDQFRYVILGGFLGFFAGIFIAFVLAVPRESTAALYTITTAGMLGLIAYAVIKRGRSAD